MPKIEYLTDEQRVRFERLQADLVYRRRVAQEVAVPLQEALEQAKARLHQGLSELGVDVTGKVVIRPDGIHFAPEGSEWNPVEGCFDPPKKKAGRGK